MLFKGRKRCWIMYETVKVIRLSDMDEVKDFIDVWNNSNCASSLNATVLYWIINTDCGLLSFQTEEFLILT